MDVNSFTTSVKKFKIETQQYKPTKNDIKQASEKIQVKFGQQLQQYLETYGYIGYKSVEFLGLSSRLGIKSDLIQNTLTMHKFSSITKEYVQIYNQGDGLYTVIDSSDITYEYSMDTNKITSLNMDFFSYILSEIEKA